MNVEKFARVREEQFPIARRYVYLDTATTGIFSTRSKDAMVGFIENRYAEGMDIDDFLRTWRDVEHARKLAAEVIDADSDEIFFSGSGSEMLNVFSAGITLPGNANVVTTDMSFPSTPYNWFNRIGEENVRIAATENGQVPCDRLFALTDENTAVIALCLTENTTGFRHDIEKIGAFCKEKGIYFVLDATQCIGAMQIDVKNTHIDYMVATTYKWLSGAFGISFAYVSKRILADIRPVYVGWTGNKDRHNHSRYKLELEDRASRFETGSLNWIGLKGIEQSMQLYLELGKADVEAYVLSLTEYLYEKATAHKDIGLVGPFPEKNRSCIVYITYPAEWKLSDAILRERGVRAHVASETTIRISLHYYNNKADIDNLFAALESLGK